ncbi:hypothetical protein M1B78_06240 [Bacteroides sp. KH569_7]|uniref:Uncharacterized protein n=1 Tax=Bacteroides muris (ex Fokt et al. 2023) TaxID=2937417 RepID=A0A9X2SWL4_9BACE|nr:hypothetical protein [Bacteroides muris (ex Fokt et al. 2023)]MCR6507782.1 hypothetical protein [Bacteroides muris (ex Fokt et al. 2023)]
MKKFADMVSDDFLYRISRLKEQYKKEYSNCEHGIVLILVNSSNKKYIIVEEEDIDNEIQERFDRIVLLLKYKSYYCGFTNVHFKFIGIFNKNNKESMIEYETIAIKKLKFTDAGCYDPYNMKYINSSELVFIDEFYNPFSSYLKKVFSQIKKSIEMAVPKGVYPDVFDDIVDNFSFTCSHLKMMYDIRDFEEYLKMIGEIDQKMSNLYRKKFNPDDYND